MVAVPGLDTPVSPGSTVGGCLLVNAIKAEVAARLTEALTKISKIEHQQFGSDWEEIDQACEIARAALAEEVKRG